MYIGEVLYENINYFDYVYGSNHVTIIFCSDDNTTQKTLYSIPSSIIMFNFIFNDFMDCKHCIRTALFCSIANDYYLYSALY